MGTSGSLYQFLVAFLEHFSSCLVGPLLMCLFFFHLIKFCFILLLSLGGLSVF